MWARVSVLHIRPIWGGSGKGRKIGKRHRKQRYEERGKPREVREGDAAVVMGVSNYYMDLLLPKHHFVENH